MSADIGATAVTRIGVDFGTTNSVAAMYEQGGVVETLARAQPGKQPIPSLVRYYQEDYVFGEDALLASRKPGDQGLLIGNMKRHLGGAGSIHVGRESFDTVEIVTRYLRFLLGRLRPAERAVVSAVVGTPVHSSSEHRVDLRAAATEAGIETVRFVYEPTAALWQALAERDSYPKGPVAVIDWGGGTVDITIVRCAWDPFRIEDMNVNAREHGLGGSDMDQEILRNALGSSSDAHHWFDSLDRSAQSRVLALVEQAKIEYLTDGSVSEHTTFEALDFVPDELADTLVLDGEMVRVALDALVSDVRALAVETTKQAGLWVDDIDYYLLVGGMVRPPMVRERLEDIWPRATELTLVPDERQRATVLGCARLAEHGFDIALGADVAVRQADDHLHRVLPRGQVLPSHEGSEAYQEYSYRITDLAAPQAVFEVGYVPPGGQYTPLSVVSVPVAHGRPKQDRVIPYDARLRLQLDRDLHVVATALGRVDDAGRPGRCRPVRSSVDLIGLPLAIAPNMRSSDA